MQRSDAEDIAAPLPQTSTMQKRSWSQPTITDEDAKNTAAAKAGGAETPTTAGPAS